MISIIMPVYNVQNYVEEAIQSLIKQTYKDWELIIVDDGSKDNSLEICKRYAEMYDKIKLIAKENGGVSSARNIGLEYASGEWIYFMDSDDEVDESCFDTIINYLNQNDNVDIICWNYLVEKKGKRLPVYSIYPHEFIEEHPKKIVKNIIFWGYEKIDNFRKRGPLRSPFNKLFHKDIIYNNNIRFDEKIKIGEDALFCAMCFHEAKRVMFVNEFLYFYRKRENSADRKYRENIEDEFNALLESTYEFLSKKCLAEDINTIFAGLAYDCVARSLEKKFVNDRNPETRKIRVKQIEDFSKNKWIQKAMGEKFNLSIFDIKQRMVIFCLKNKLYSLLYALEKIKLKR